MRACAIYASGHYFGVVPCNGFHPGVAQSFDVEKEIGIGVKIIRGASHRQIQQLYAAAL
jgi:hypothetical protein